jgi:co-chaperonin GroES (HSP10)
MKTLDRTSIYDSPSQLLDHLDPSQIRPIHDRVLIRDIHDDDKIGSIFLPERDDHWSGTKDHARLGVVVAVGLGDKWLESWGRWVESNGKVHTFLRQKALTTESRRWPMQCKPGDKVIVDRRRDEEIYIAGDRYYLCHEEQAILGIIEE